MCRLGGELTDQDHSSNNLWVTACFQTSGLLPWVFSTVAPILYLMETLASNAMIEYTHLTFSL